MSVFRPCPSPLPPPDTGRKKTRVMKVVWKRGIASPFFFVPLHVRVTPPSKSEKRTWGFDFSEPRLRLISPMQLFRSVFPRHQREGSVFKSSASNCDLQVLFQPQKKLLRGWVYTIMAGEVRLHPFRPLGPVSAAGTHSVC